MKFIKKIKISSIVFWTVLMLCVILYGYFIIGVRTGTYCNITQEVDVEDYILNKYEIYTAVRIYNWYGWSINTALFNAVYGINKTDIDSIKKVEYNKAYPKYREIKNFLEKK
jgi:hypothetical protein